MHRAPLLAPAIAALMAIGAEQRGAGALALVAAAACAAALAWRMPVWTWRTVAACSIALVTGVAISAVRGHPAIVSTERATARYTATVTGDVRVTDSGGYATVLTLDGSGVIRTMLFERIAPGDRFTVRGRLEPFDEPRNPGEPSMRETERDGGIAGELTGARIISHRPRDARDARTWAARLRAGASSRLRAVIPEPEATLLAGVLWGERGTLPDDIHDAFQATGTVHVLVTAGLHLGIIAALALGLLRLCGAHRIAASAAAIGAIVFYAWFSGAHLPSERAAAMISVALCARACGARVTSWNALALAALVVAALWPAAVMSASFAMSFSCLTAILFFAKPFAGALARFPLPERVNEALALTCATQLGTWPLTAAMFSSIAPYGIVANAIVVPLIGVAMPFGLMTLAFPPIAPLTTLVAMLIERVVQTVSAAPGAQASVGMPSGLSLAAYDALAITAGVLLAGRKPAFVIPALVLGAAVIIVPQFIHAPHGLTVTHLDVGQADAAVIRTPGDRIILIDAGGELERRGPTSNAERAGKRIVLAYLRRMGIKRIDLMILTHPHGDHVGGCSPIIEAMPVALLFDSGQTYNGRAFRDCITSAKAHGVRIALARLGMQWMSGDGLTIHILAPSVPFLSDTGDDVNENSIVAMLQFGGFRELFLGDAGEASESRLLKGRHDLHADVVKVGHHGSRYASTAPFVAAVQPRIAVISVGRHNTFGHPAQATIQAWDAAGAYALRTDECGAISLREGSPTTMLRCGGLPMLGPPLND